MVDKHVVIPSLLMQGTLAVGWLYLFLLNWILLFANGAVEHRAFPFHPSHAHNTWKATNHNKAESFKGSLLWHCLPAFIPVPSQSLQKPTKREMDAGENNKKLKKKYKIKGLSQRNKGQGQTSSEISIWVKKELQGTWTKWKQFCSVTNCWAFPRQLLTKPGQNWNFTNFFGRKNNVLLDG